MFDVLVATHGRLGEELLDTARLVYGDLGAGVEAIGFTPGESQDELKNRIEEKVMASAERGGCLVLCDILGGSPFLAASQAWRTAPADAPVEVVCGVNLAMLVEVCACRAYADMAEGAQAAADAAAQSIRKLSDAFPKEEA